MGSGRSKIKGLFQKTTKSSSENSNSSQNNHNVRGSGHETIEMSVVDQNSVNSVTIFCDSKDEFLHYFESSLENELSTVLLVRIEFSCALPELDVTNLQMMTDLCAAKPLVLLLLSKIAKTWSIFWKSKTEGFLKLQHLRKLTWDENLLISEYVADFLAKSLNNHHLGLTNKIQFQPGLKPVGIDFIADSREFNLLLLATEQGNVKIVEILLKLEMNLTSNDGKINAQSLAMDCKQFDILHAFLQSNFKFPKNFKAQNCTGRFKDFCEVTEEVHKLIMSNEKEKLDNIFDQYGHLSHFYDFSNKSALMVAIESGAYDVFDLLLSKKFRFGSHENPGEFYDQLDIKSKRIVRDIQNKYSQPFLEKHIRTLTANSTACFDETEAKDKYDKVLRAFELLSLNPFVKIILKIVAASKNFKIVFDFNREAVNILDPTTTDSTQGIFYFSGRIFVGAKQLLNTQTEHETLAVLIHELCHFAMNLVYKNKAKPYKSNDQKTQKEFEEISILCEELSDKEEVIRSIYECYPEEAFHAELIVRVVHLMMLYRSEPEKMAEVRTTYIKLFEFYEKKIVPELEQAVPEIEGSEEKELKIKERKISNLQKIAIFGGILSIVGVLAAIVVGLVLYTPTYRFDELSIEDRMIVIEAKIIYKNTSLEFRDLFNESSEIYSQLTSDHISQMLRGVPLELSDPHFRYLEEQVNLTWKNLTEKLKEKFLTSNVTFQNETLKFEDLHSLTRVAFNNLNSEQIVKVLDGKELVLHKMIKNETKFYVERKFFDESMYEIYFDYMLYPHNNTLIKYCTAEKSIMSSITFEEFYYKFVNKSFETQFKRIDEIKNRADFMKCRYSEFQIVSSQFSTKDTLSSHTMLHMDFNQVLSLSNETKMFILSDEAGTGKTATFEQFTMRIKRKFPTQWVSYIDLKDHKDVYKGIQTIKDVQEMFATIFGLSSDNIFEMRVFEELFDSGNAIFLWNGFDEISPEFSEDVMRILWLIRNVTQSIQFICTRPIYSKTLRDQFMVRTYTLVPFNETDQYAFVEKFSSTENINATKVPNFIKKVLKIINSASSKDDFNIPLMLGMFAELVANDVEIFESENLYQIYQKFIYKKIEIWKRKSEFAGKFLSILVSENSGFNMMNYYQSFALKNELDNANKIGLYYALNLKIMRQRIPKELTNDEISRMGILYINGPKNAKFAHKTFSEFFAAKFIIDKIYNCNDELPEIEAKARDAVFLFIFKQKGVQRFIKSYMKSMGFVKQDSFNLKIVENLVKWEKFLFADFDESDYILLINFFQNDPVSIKMILKIDENETFYTKFFNFANRPRFNPVQIREISKFILTDEEFKKFISGKNQKGIILFNSYFSIDKPQHDVYILNEMLLNNPDPFFVFESIVKILTIDEFKALFEIENIWENIYFRMDSSIRIDRLTFDENMWNLIEQKSTKSDQKEIILSLFKSMTQYEANSSLYFKLNKTNFLLSNSEIFNLFLESNLLFKMIEQNENFKTVWAFFIQHTNKSQQKEFLKRNIPCDFNIFVPMNFISISILKENSFMIKVYESLFTQTEIRNIFISQSTDILFYFVYREHRLQNLFQYLENIAHEACFGHCFEKFYKRKTELENLGILSLK